MYKRDFEPFFSRGGGGTVDSHNGGERSTTREQIETLGATWARRSGSDGRVKPLTGDAIGSQPLPDFATSSGHVLVLSALRTGSKASKPQGFERLAPIRLFRPVYSSLFPTMSQGTFRFLSANFVASAVDILLILVRFFIVASPLYWIMGTATR